MKSSPGHAYKTAKDVINRIMSKGFDTAKYCTGGYPDTFGSNGFVECKAWCDVIRPNQIAFYEFLVANGLAHLWTIAAEDQAGEVHLLKSPQEYIQFKELRKTKIISWDIIYPQTVVRTNERSRDGSTIWLVKCPNPFQNPRCNGTRKMKRKTLDDSRRSGTLGQCRSCGALSKSGAGERLVAVRIQAPKGTIRQGNFAKSLGTTQAFLANLVKLFGIEWKRTDGRAPNKRRKVS
jgi:hypothetical protein